MTKEISCSCSSYINNSNTLDRKAIPLSLWLHRSQKNMLSSHMSLNNNLLKIITMLFSQVSRLLGNSRINIIDRKLNQSIWMHYFPNPGINQVPFVQYAKALHLHATKMIKKYLYLQLAANTFLIFKIISDWIGLWLLLCTFQIVIFWQIINETNFNKHRITNLQLLFVYI